MGQNAVVYSTPILLAITGFLLGFAPTEFTIQRPLFLIGAGKEWRRVGTVVGTRTDDGSGERAHTQKEPADHHGE